jgi:anthranilate/para-aminobenzoate synthase component I
VTPAPAPGTAHATPAPAPTVAPSTSATAAQAPTPVEEYDETVRKGDALFAAGDYFEAVRTYEHAWRVAYNNKLKTDAKALDERLAAARKARDEKKSQK